MRVVGLLVPVNLLALLVALLGFHRKRRDRAGLEALQRNRLAGLLAIAVGVVLDSLQRRVDLGDQLALAITGAQLNGAVGLRGGAVGQIRMIDVLLLQRLQGELRLAQNLVFPGQELGPEILLLPVVHERLFFRRPVVLQLFQGQPICVGERRGSVRGPPYIAPPCRTQYDPDPKPDRPQGLAQASLSSPAGGGSEGPATAPLGASIADREAVPDMGWPLDLVGQGDGVVLKADPAPAVSGGQQLVGSEPELAGALAGDEQGRGREERPVQFLLLPQQVEEGGALLGLRLVLGREGRRRDQPDTG